MGATLGELYPRYRQHLREQGLNDEAVRKVFGELEVDRWDRIFTDPKSTYNREPNSFLVSMMAGRTPGKALDVGVGSGRNAIYLAKQGWTVTGFDISEQALALTRQNAAAAGVKVATIRADDSSFDFGVDQWDLVVGTYVGANWSPRAIRGLKPGGLLLIEGFLRSARTPQGASFSPNELLKIVQGELRILRYEDTQGTPDWARNMDVPGGVIRLLGEKPVK